MGRMGVLEPWVTGAGLRGVRKLCSIQTSLPCPGEDNLQQLLRAPMEPEIPLLIWDSLGVFLLAGSPKISPDVNRDFPLDSMLTGNWNYSQVTVHVHGQEVLSEETVHPEAEPESPSELQNPVQTSTPEASREETIQSPDLGPPEEQSLCHELEFQPLQESGGKPQQKRGIVTGRAWEGGYFPSTKEARCGA